MGGGEGGGEGGWGYVMVYSVYIYIQYLLIKAFSIITKIYKRKGDDPRLTLLSLPSSPSREEKYALFCVLPQLNAVITNMYLFAFAFHFAARPATERPKDHSSSEECILSPQ